MKSDVENLNLSKTRLDCSEADFMNFETEFLVHVFVNYSVYDFLLPSYCADLR